MEVVYDLIGDGAGHPVCGGHPGDAIAQPSGDFEQVGLLRFPESSGQLRRGQSPGRLRGQTDLAAEAVHQLTAESFAFMNASGDLSFLFG